MLLRRSVAMGLCGMGFLLWVGLAVGEGLITQLKGRATLSRDSAEQPQAVVPFMKLRPGDRLELAPDARLQVLFTGNGRQETWPGGTVLRVEENQSTPLSLGIQPLVRNLPTVALARLAKAPTVLNDLQNRSGMVMVRSGGLLEQIREVESTYSELRGAAQSDDITPELFLLSALHDLNLHKDIPVILEDMAAKQPDNSRIRGLLEQMRGEMIPAPAGDENNQR